MIDLEFKDKSFYHKKITYSKNTKYSFNCTYHAHFMHKLITSQQNLFNWQKFKTKTYNHVFVKVSAGTRG